MPIHVNFFWIGARLCFFQQQLFNRLGASVAIPIDRSVQNFACQSKPMVYACTCTPNVDLVCA